MVKYSKKPGKKRAIRKQPSKKGKRSGKSPRRSRLVKAVKKRRKTKLRGAGLNKIEDNGNKTHVIIKNTSSSDELKELGELATGLSDNDVKNIFHLAEYCSYLLYLCANFSEQINEFIDMKNNGKTAFPGLSDGYGEFKKNFEPVTHEEIYDNDTFFEFNYVENLYVPSTGNTNGGGARSKTQFGGGGLDPTFRKHLINAYKLCDRWLQKQNEIEIFAASGQDAQISSLQTEQQDGIKSAIFSPAIFNILSLYTFILETNEETREYSSELYDVCAKIFLFRYSDDYNNPNTYHHVKEEIRSLLSCDTTSIQTIYSFNPTLNVLVVNNRDAVIRLREAYVRKKAEIVEAEREKATIFLPPPPGHRHQGKFFKVTRSGVDTTERFTAVVTEGIKTFVSDGGVYSPPVKFNLPPPAPPPGPPPVPPPRIPAPPPQGGFGGFGPPPSGPAPPIPVLASRVLDSNSARKSSQQPKKESLVYGNPERIKSEKIDDDGVLYGNPNPNSVQEAFNRLTIDDLPATSVTDSGHRYAAVGVTPQPTPVPRVRPCNTFKAKDRCERTGYCDWLDFGDGEPFCLGKE